MAKNRNFSKTVSKRKLAKLVILAFLIVFSVFGITKAGWFSDDDWNDIEEPFMILVEENGITQAALAHNETVAQFLSRNQIEITERDFIFPEKDKVIFPGMKLIIKRAIPVKILVDGQEQEIQTLGQRVKQVLEEEKIVLGQLDEVEPQLNEPIFSGMEITITRINKGEIKVKEEIDFEVIEKENDKLAWRKRKIKQEGEKGVREVVYEVTYENGKEKKRKKLSSLIVKEPVPEIIEVGTKIEVGKVKKGLASWYAYTGTMACASRMFPKGTWLRVTNLQNQKQVIVVVNDYGPARGTGKMIDLDKVAFEKLANLSQGVIEVKVEEILN